MDKKKVIIIVLVIVIIALAAYIFAPSLFMNSQKDTVKIYNNTIAGVGTFNTTNVTNFTLDNSSNNVQTDYLANDSRAQVSVINSTDFSMNASIAEAQKVNDSAKGHTIYKNTATVGQYKGEVRYFSYLKDNDKQRYVYISTGDYNLTCMIVDSFKMI